jgi:uncharacterized protein (TIGR02145 family)
MNFMKIKVIFIFCICLIAVLQSCKKEIPAVTTRAASEITQTSAKSGGDVTDNGGAEVTDRGVCWGTASDPVLGSNKTNDGTGNGTFTSSITGLTASTLYYIRAYAINSEGIGYGDQVSFTTSEIPPVADFSASTTTITAGQSVQFTDQSTNNPASWSWNFGDGTTSTTQSPSHPYSAAGTYTVTLTVTNSAGSDTETKTNYIKVNPVVVTPVAAFTASATIITAGQSVQFTDQSTNNPASWSWNFGDGTTSTTKSPAHVYSTAGTYTVSLTATNSAGSDIETKTNYIRVNPPIVIPIAAFTASATSIIAGQSVQFTDQSTNNPVSWSWNFGDGTTSTTKSPAHVYSTAGTYTVSLTATNSAGSDIETKTNYISVGSNTISDIDNNTYKTITIGLQVWMAENLKTTKYRDGNLITMVTDATLWTNLTSEAYCWYDNDAATYKNTYGALYNWYAVNTGKLCPSGWHVPIDAEWIELEMFIGMTREVAELTYWRGTNEGTKLKSTTGWYMNGNGTNDVGFTALPAGMRYNNGEFRYIGNWTDFWSSTEINSTRAWSRAFGYLNANIGRYDDTKQFGFCIRCIKD